MQWAPALNGCGAGSEEDRALAAELAKEGIVMNVEDGPPEGAEVGALGAEGGMGGEEDYERKRMCALPAT